VCSDYFNLEIHETTAVGESILTQAICKTCMLQHPTSVFQHPSDTVFGWMVGKNFALRLRNLDSRLRIKERAVECSDGFLAKSCKSIQNIKSKKLKRENGINTNISRKNGK
jgi:hypothetical protein